MSVSERADVAEDLLAKLQALEAQAEVGHALTTALHAHTVAADAKIENLEAALATSRRIGAAVGIIMATHKIAYDDAFAALRVASNHSQRKLRDVADEVVITGVLPTSE